MFGTHARPGSGVAHTTKTANYIEAALAVKQLPAEPTVLQFIYQFYPYNK